MLVTSVFKRIPCQDCKNQGLYGKGLTLYRWDNCSSLKKFLYDYPFPKQQNLDSSKLKVFADNNFKLDENGRNFSKWVENTVGEGEIAHCKQFLLFLQCFQKTCIADLYKPRLVWEWVKYIYSTIYPPYDMTCLWKTIKCCGKGRRCW